MLDLKNIRRKGITQPKHYQPVCCLAERSRHQYVRAWLSSEVISYHYTRMGMVLNK